MNEIVWRIEYLEGKIKRYKELAPHRNGSDHIMFGTPEEVAEIERELEILTQINNPNKNIPYSGT